jgi:hypothetical protein
MRKRRHFIPIIFLILSFLFNSCSKEKIEQNIIVDAVTNGRWLVTQFSEAGTEVSLEFAPFEFQFFENGIVQAFNGSTITTGNWTANVDARTITSTFPGTNTTLNRLNDTWKIFNSSLTLVEANPLNTSRIAYLKMNKK